MNVAAVPDSDVTSPLVGDTVMPPRLAIGKSAVPVSPGEAPVAATGVTSKVSVVPASAGTVV